MMIHCGDPISYANLNSSYWQVPLLRLRAFTMKRRFSMAISKSAKIMAEMEKVKAKISDQQARLKELEQKHKEAENEEIVDIVRGMSISLEELPAGAPAHQGRGRFGTKCPEVRQAGKGGRGMKLKKISCVGGGSVRRFLLCGITTTAYAGGGEEWEDGTGGPEWEGLTPWSPSHPGAGTRAQPLYPGRAGDDGG